MTNARKSVTLHRLSWAAFDQLARGEGGADAVRDLWRAERSRRLLLLRALVEQTTKTPEIFGPLPPTEDAWELLVRVEAQVPSALEVILAHPYTGSWAGYTARLIRQKITGALPLWMHVGHLHALAAAAAIHAAIDFDVQIPIWHGQAVLPSLGLAQLAAQSPWSVARVRSERSQVIVSNAATCVALPADRAAPAPGWWGIRRLTMRAHARVFSVHLDDLDPYRGLYEPVAPQRLDSAEVRRWRALLEQAWWLIVEHLPDLASALDAGIDSLVPRPATPFRIPSASTGEAFGSAIIARPPDAATLAATLVHEFHHIRLGGLLHLIRLHDDDYRERFYTPWRDDPRPIGGVLQGLYAFFGVTGCWRAFAAANPEAADHTDQFPTAPFEFGYWRQATWRVLRGLRDDPALTPAGRRFVAGIADRLGSWQREPVPATLGDLVAAAAADHYAGWRIRHVRPDPGLVAALVDAWRAGTAPAMTGHTTADWAPTPVPDGDWSPARIDLIRLGVAAGQHRARHLRSTWPAIPGATAADFAYATGRPADAARGYRAALAANADCAASLIGLGLCLSELGVQPAAGALLHYPELVRAVHRGIRQRRCVAPTPEELAGWIGRFVS